MGASKRGTAVLGVESGRLYTCGSGFTQPTLKLPKAVIVLDAGFHRDISCQSAFVPVPGVVRGDNGIRISASTVTSIMSNPNDPRDASLETRVTFPKSWNRDEAG